MLKQALDSEGDHGDHLENESKFASETARLTDGERDEYGSSSAGPLTHASSDQMEDGEVLSWSDDDVDELSSLPSVEAQPSRFGRAWQAIVGCCKVFADVDNLWDSPRQGRRSRKSMLVVLSWFTMLASAYAMERVTFKVLVDRLGPYRLFTAEVIAAMHAIFVGVGMFISALISALSQRKFELKPLGIPLVDVGLIAVLDTIHLVLAFVTGKYVPPVLIVICVQLMIPLTALFSQVTHPEGCARRCCVPDEEHRSYSRAIRGCGGLSTEHVLGSVILTVAVFLGLLPSILSFWGPNLLLGEVPVVQTAYNTLLFTANAIPAAASQVYKEQAFLHYRQPVDPTYLNFVLSVFQLLISLPLSPLAYVMLGLGADSDGVGWYNLFPAAEVWTNYGQAWQCFFGSLPENIAQNSYREEAKCSLAFPLTVFHVFSIVMVGVAVDKIVHAGATRVLYRGISAGIIVAVIAMFIHSLDDKAFNHGPIVDSLYFICTVLIILGSEVYHRVDLEDATFETVYPPVPTLEYDNSSV